MGADEAEAARKVELRIELIDGKWHSRDFELPAEVLEIGAQDYPDGTVVEIRSEQCRTKP